MVMGFLRELFVNKTNSRQQNASNGNSYNVYSKLTHYQKLAAMNLMMAFGGSCSGSPQELSKINHIMSEEGRLLGVSGDEMHAATSRFSGMKGMSDALKDADKSALEKLFWAFYCITAVGKNSQAAQVLMVIYKDYGFSEQECISILEKHTGKKMGEL